MSSHILRPYQQKAVDGIRHLYMSGIKRVLLHLATGAGKTTIFSYILKSLVQRGKRGIMVVRGKDLVEQASQRLFREDVPHGVMQANHWNDNPSAPVQVCSIDTLFRRKIAPPADLVVIDEAQFAVSESFKWLIENYKDSFFLPVTATPHVKSGLRHIADDVINPISMKELIAQGFLVPPRYYAPSRPDLSEVGIDSKTRDYKNDELGRAVSKTSLIGDIVSHYQEITRGVPAICFAVNISHSKMIEAQFNEAGIPARHVEANTSPENRRQAIDDLSTGKIKVITNVGILCTGVDIPFLKAVIMARPTLSYNLFVQQAGRGTRPFDNKDSFFLLDHAGNIERHGFIEDERPCDLDGWQTERQTSRNSLRTCKKCYAVYDPAEHEECPACGAKPDPIERKKKIEVDTDKKLIELKYMENVTDESEIQKMILKAKNKGYKKGWVYHKIKEKFGEDHANRVWKSIKNMRWPEPIERAHGPGQLDTEDVRRDSIL